MGMSEAAVRAFLRSALLLLAALGVFAGVFLLRSNEPAVPPPRDDVLEGLAEAKRQELRLRMRSWPDGRDDGESTLVRSLLKTEPRPAQPAATVPAAGATAPAMPSDGTMDGDVMKAIALIDNGQVGEAVAALEAIVKKDPRNEQALVELAMIHLLDMKDPEQATSYLQRAIQVNPGNQVVMSELVSLFDEQQRFDEGMQFLSDLEKQNPGSPDVAYGLGQLLTMQGRDADAIPYLERAAQTGDPLRAYRDLAEAYSRAGDPERAIDSYNKAIATLERDALDKKNQGMPAGYVEERINYTKLDKARELIRVGDLEQAQGLLDEVSHQMPGDESIMALQESLNRKRG